MFLDKKKKPITISCLYLYKHIGSSINIDAHMFLNLFCLMFNSKTVSSAKIGTAGIKL